MPDEAAVLDAVTEISASFAAHRRERQLRQTLDAADFDALRDAGFLLTGLDRERGGLWVDVRRSTRPIAEILRRLARGDPSVALVCAMHPAVLSFWLATPTAPDPFAAAWSAQREEVTGTTQSGAWWGTITSEPGSGGDIARTRAAATPSGDGGWTITGQKHFGSGAGNASFMLTSALPEGADAPDWFVVDMRSRPLDGSAGVRLIAPWDGHGMRATQSHSLAFDALPATRFAWPGQWKTIADAASPFVGTVFTAVIVGVVEEAMAAARRDLAPRKDALRAYERVELVQAQTEAWLAVQAFEGMLRTVEEGSPALLTVLRGKTAVAELAESALRRLCRVLGGGTFARHNPYGFWFEDVRALGFLRPPWALAFDSLYEAGLAQE